MQRTEGAQTPYEVYCYNCRTTFAAGTRVCVHCGNRIGRVGAGPAGGPIPDSFHPEEEDEDGISISVARRLGGIGIWVLLALAATLMRLCEGGGA